MKLGLLGDIHGNHLALHAALAAASSYDVEKLLVTGDLVGYYFAPTQVLELLQAWDWHMVRGNHEEMLNSARSDPAFLGSIDAQYGSGLRIALEQLETQQIDDLCNMPHPLEMMIDGCRVLLCHGAPWDIDHYLYPDAESEMMDRCAEQAFDLIVLGHTHYPMYRKISKTLMVNPGSVGQPRNRKPGAHWALFDTESREVTLHCEAYNTGPLVEESRRRHPGIPYLADVLERT